MLNKFGNTDRGIALGIGAGLATLFGIVGNSLVIYAFTRQRKQVKRHFFLLCLCGMEVMASASYVPISYRAFGGTQAIGNTFTCDLEGLGVGFAAISAVYIMMLVSMERYLAICRPLQLRQWTLSGKMAAVGGVCAVSLTLNVIPLSGWSRFSPMGQSRRFCCFDLSGSPEARAYFVCLFLLGFATPSAVLFAAYGLIWRSYRGSLATASFREGARAGRLGPARVSRDSGTLLRTSLAVVGSFMGAWLPFAVVASLANYAVIPRTQAAAIAVEVTAFFAKLFVLYNPLIYGLLDPRFRTVFRPSSNSLRSNGETPLTQRRPLLERTSAQERPKSPVEAPLETEILHDCAVVIYRI